MGGTRTAPDPAWVLSWGACSARSLLRHGGDRQPREAPRTRTATSHACDTPACAGLCKRGRVSPTGDTIVRQPIPTVSPLLTPAASRNLLLLQSLPTSIPYRQ